MRISITTNEDFGVMCTLSSPYETDLSTGINKASIENLYHKAIKPFETKDFHYLKNIKGVDVNLVIKPSNSLVNSGISQHNYYVLKNGLPIFFAKLEYYPNNTYKSIFGWRNSSSDSTKGLLSLIYTSILEKSNLESSNIVSSSGKHFWSNFSKGKKFFLVDKNRTKKIVDIEECFSSNMNDMTSCLLFPKQKVSP